MHSHTQTLTPTTTPQTKMLQPILNLNFFRMSSFLSRLPTQFYLILVGGTNVLQSFTTLLPLCNVIIVINISQAKVYN